VAAAELVLAAIPPGLEKRPVQSFGLDQAGAGWTASAFPSVLSPAGLAVSVACPAGTAVAWVLARSFSAGAADLDSLGLGLGKAGTTGTAGTAGFTPAGVLGVAADGLGGCAELGVVGALETAASEG